MTTPKEDAAPGPLPPIQDVELDPDGVAALLADIAALGAGLAIAVRAHGGRRGSPGPPAIADLVPLVRDRAVAAVQLRYDHGGESWCDTLTATPTGWRLVRISHTRAVRSAQAAAPPP